MLLQMLLLIIIVFFKEIPLIVKMTLCKFISFSIKRTVSSVFKAFPSLFQVSFDTIFYH